MLVRVNNDPPGLLDWSLSRFVHLISVSSITKGWHYSIIIVRDSLLSYKTITLVETSHFKSVQFLECLRYLLTFVQQCFPLSEYLDRKNHPVSEGIEIIVMLR